MQKKYILKYLPLFYFLTLTLLIMGPLLSSGYFFLLDYTPHNINLNLMARLQEGDLLNNLPLETILFVLNQFFSPDILEKIIFSLALFLPGYLFCLFAPKKLGELPRIIAGTFYMINPFVYERLVAGHFNILLAYALLPVCFYYFQKVFEPTPRSDPGVATWWQKNKNFLLAAFFWTLATIFSAHFFVIIGIMFAGTFGAVIPAYRTSRLELLMYSSVNRGPTTTRIYNKFSPILKTLFFLLIFNSFWLIPSFLYSNNVLTNSDVSHFQAFQTASDPQYGLLANITGMYGFWRERTTGGEIVLTKNLLPLWPLLLTPFFALIILGAIKLWKERQKRLLFILLTLISIAIFFNLSPANNFIGGVNQWIFLNIPGFRGLREIEKISSLLVFSYAFLIVWGLSQTLNVCNRFASKILYLFILLLIFAFNFKMLWGFGGQIKTIPYPQSYEHIQKILKDEEESKVLLLPWQMYMRYSPGDGRTIADPLRFLPSGRTIATYDIGLEEIKAEKETWEEEKIKMLLRQTDPQLWQEVLRKMKVKYIFVHKTPLGEGERINDWFLKESNRFELIFEDEFGKIYKHENI